MPPTDNEGKKMLTQNSTNPIAKLNDKARANWFDRRYCRTLLTHGIRALIEQNNDDLQGLMLPLVNFDDFTPDNDPYGEHDFGSFHWGGDKIFWKIDYYDLSYQYGSEDPANPVITRRVLTVMLASEY